MREIAEMEEVTLKLLWKRMHLAIKP
jgi:hypothetical protein